MSNIKVLHVFFFVCVCVKVYVQDKQPSKIDAAFFSSYHFCIVLSSMSYFVFLKLIGRLSFTGLSENQDLVFHLFIF